MLTFIPVSVLTLAAFAAGALSQATGEWTFAVIAVFLVTGNAILAWGASTTGIVTGFESSYAALTAQQLYNYLHYVSETGAVKVYLANPDIRPAKSVYHARLDGANAIIIECAEEKPYAETVEVIQ